MDYEPQKIEEKILRIWKREGAHKKRKAKNRRGKKFFYMDGPPYANGDPHPGTAWNRVHKDMVRRFYWMNGYDVWDQPGFDCHGLPIETTVEKKFGLKNKEDIKRFGEERFIRECRKLAEHNVKVMSKMFERLGEWATWENPYLTLNNDYIESVWWALKEAWKKKLLYKGKRVLHWCPRCSTALAQNYEIVYKKLREESIYVKFPLKGKDNEYLVIWTTTPWTIPYNLAVMAHPEEDYVRVRTNGEVWILAKERLDHLLPKKNYEILEEFKGKEMEGLAYWHPFITEIQKLQEMKEEWAFKVVLSEEYVDVKTGSGLVHSAPGCGPEDFEVGQRYGLPPFNTVDEYGVLRDVGPLSGLVARKDDWRIIELLEEKGLLVKKEEIEHDYPVCERCKTPVIFRATDQWFLGVTKLKEKMLRENKKVKWVPEWAGERRFANWLESIKDWCITRQRYWGIPFPVWTCDKCGKFVVIGSTKELKKKPKDLHKPHIDRVTWKCECGGTFRRNPDVVDVWIDSACVPFASLSYPKKKEPFKRLYPADLIIESHDQIRGWFYSLMAMNTMLFGKCPYKAVYMHGYMLDEKGEEMSKRKGNYVPVPEILKKFGADVFRITMMSTSNPGVDVRYNEKTLREGYKALNMLWNLQFLLKNAAKLHKIKVRPKVNTERFEDKWVVSRVNSLAKEVTKSFQSYLLSEPGKLLTGFISDLSKWYVKLVRNRLFNKGKEEAEVVLGNLAYVYEVLLRLMAPITPFVTDEIYRKMFGESVHLQSWPKPDGSLIDEKVEEEMEEVREVVGAVLRARDQAGVGIRWPLKRVMLVGKGVPHEEIVKEVANVKDVEVIFSHPEEVKIDFKFNYESLKRFGDGVVPTIISKLIGADGRSIRNKLDRDGKFPLEIDGKVYELVHKDFEFEIRTPPRLVAVEVGGRVMYVDFSLEERLKEEGYVRELVRRIQQLRKEHKLERGDFCVVRLSCDPELRRMVEKHREEVEEKTNSRLEFGEGEKEYAIGDKKVKVTLLTP